MYPNYCLSFFTYIFSSGIPYLKIKIDSYKHRLQTMQLTKMPKERNDIIRKHKPLKIIVWYLYLYYTN